MSSTRRVTKIKLRATVASRGEARAYTSEPGDAALVQRGVFRLLIIRCPCGCGDDLILNVDQRAGPAWKFYQRHGRLSVYPSYWRETGCESHFIVWNDQVLWCDAWNYETDHDTGDRFSEQLLTRFDDSEFLDYHIVADELDEVPWEILWSCRRLVKSGRLEERSGKEKGFFRKRKDLAPVKHDFGRW